MAKKGYHIHEMDKGGEIKYLAQKVSAPVKTQPPRELHANATRSALCMRISFRLALVSFDLPLPPRLLDGCPSQILSINVEGTCIDDGFTGRSLSLLSKRIRDLRLP